MTHIIKRQGRKQEFDERKLYASIYAACLSTHVDKQEAEVTANLVVREIRKWMEKKQEVSSDEIFKQASEELMSLNKEAAFMYTTHRDIS
ncbi:hypothetical protein HYT74_03070 [Candidatus Daviesbacteria bacterium]|nr:hypothetical protein [Candidatus Daviesbacteria bacterium]